MDRIKSKYLLKGMKKFSIEQMPSLVSSHSKGSFSRSSCNLKELNRKNTNKIGYGSIKDIKITRTIPAMETSTNIGLLSDIHVRTFADNNLINCECESILTTMYKQMIEHCQDADINDKLMSALLEYATLCIKFQNITVAFTLLEKATDLLEQKLKFEYPEPNWQVPLTRGRIKLLKAQLHIERTAFDEAECCLRAALKCYNLTFPSDKLNIKIKTNINELKQKIIVEYFPHRYIGSRNEDVCTLAEQTSDVLSSLFLLYRRKLCFDKAYLASIWGMNEALRSDSNFYVMCHAYSNVLTMNLVYNRLDIMSKLEEMAINMCYRKHTRLENHELEAVSRLYGAIFCRKFFCDNVLESLKLGTIVVQLNSPLFGGNYHWLMLPVMLKALVFSYLPVQAALLVKEMTYYKFTNQTHFAPMMYYTLCLEFRMYTSYSIESFSIVNSNITVKLLDYTQKILSTIEMRYHVNIWLWYLRRREWESAGSLNEHIECICKWGHTAEPALVYVLIHILEGFLLIIVRKIDVCDNEGIKKPIKYVKKILKDLSKVTDKLITIKSRYLLLKAYWYIINKNDRKAFQTLDKASVFAKKCSVLYDIDWIEHTRDLWLQPNSAHHVIDEWLSATETETLNIQWETEDDNSAFPIPFFSFHLPLN